MQFIVLGYDGTDENALERRLKVREAHLNMASEMHKAGKWLYAAAILDENQKMCGSMIVCQFDTEEALKKEWLEKEPYVLGDVWRTIEIKPAAVAPFCAP